MQFNSAARLLALTGILFLACCTLSSCAKEEGDTDSAPELTVTGFRVFTNAPVSFAPNQTIRIPAIPDAYIEISASLRDDERLRGIKYRITPDFPISVPSTGTDSIWNTPLFGPDTFSRAQVVLTNQRFVTFINANVRKTNESGGGTYLLRIVATDASGNTSPESVHRIEVTD